MVSTMHKALKIRYTQIDVYLVKLRNFDIFVPFLVQMRTRKFASEIY